jgi:reverse gyrase
MIQLINLPSGQGKTTELIKRFLSDDNSIILCGNVETMIDSIRFFIKIKKLQIKDITIQDWKKSRIFSYSAIYLEGLTKNYDVILIDDIDRYIYYTLNMKRLYKVIGTSTEIEKTYVESLDIKKLDNEIEKDKMKQFIIKRGWKNPITNLEIETSKWCKLFDKTNVYNLEEAYMLELKEGEKIGN